MPRLLIADDDAELCGLLADYLQQEGFETESVHDGEAALSLALVQDFDLIILDVMMPKRDGLEVLRLLRVRRQTPVLMLTARGEDADSVAGLELGADDYLAKPSSLQVLSARIRAILRRSEPRAIAAETDTLQIGDIALKRNTRSVLRAGQVLSLTSTQFSVLEVLMLEAGKAVTKNELSERVLGRALGRFDRSLDMHISNIRHLLGLLPNGEDRIKTIRGVGYQYTGADE